MIFWLFSVSKKKKNSALFESESCRRVLVWESQASCILMERKFVKEAVLSNCSSFATYYRWDCWKVLSLFYLMRSLKIQMVVNNMVSYQNVFLFVKNVFGR